MINETNLINDEFEDMLRTATNEVLSELGLKDRVRIRIIQPEIDSDYYGVGLIERTGPATSNHPHFKTDSAEALTAVHGGRITVESLKPLVLREVLKIFPEVASAVA
jgi:hypothetical protein